MDKSKIRGQAVGTRINAIILAYMVDRRKMHVLLEILRISVYRHGQER